MDEYVKELFLKFQDDIKRIEEQNLDIDVVLETIKKQTREDTAAYLETDDYKLKEKLKTDLIRDYNLMYYYQAKRNGIKHAYWTDVDIVLLPNIYLIDQTPERFEINEQLLEDINIAEGLTMDQAIELLKWVSNNTRDNLVESTKGIFGELKDVYGNDSLAGCCGFAQFSTLFPLQKMGLKITINNTSKISLGDHAFGTVIIPIKTENIIVYKRFLIDCSYRQFFSIPENVVARYLDNTPNAGFFVNKQTDEIAFARELLRNGFIEADLENLKKYLKPFFSTSIAREETSKIDEEFNNLDILDIIENKQVRFFISEEKFSKGGGNLDLPRAKAKEF